MALTNKAYTTVDDVKAALDTNTTDNDDLIQTFISQAQKVIDEYLGFSFQTEGTAAAPAERIFDGNGTYQLLIDPMLTLSSVKIRSYSYTSDPNTGDVTRTQSDGPDITGQSFLGPQSLDFGFILERVNHIWPVGKRNVVVTGVWGKFAQVPADIKRACTRLAVHYMKQMDASYQNTIGDTQFGTLVFSQDIPSDVCHILDKHKPRIFRTR